MINYKLELKIMQYFFTSRHNLNFVFLLLSQPQQNSLKQKLIMSKDFAPNQNKV